MIGFLIGNARWLFAGFLLMFMSSFGQTFFIALFSGEIRAELGLSHGQFGTIYGVATLTSAVVLIWVGKFADSDNLRRVAVVVCLMLAAATLGMAWVTGPLMLFGVIFGLRLFGQAMMMHISQTAIGRWFSARRGKALAITGFGFPTSEAVLPPLAVILIAAVGWRNVWICGAALLVLVAAPVLAVLLNADRTPQSRSAASHADARPDQRHWTRAEMLRDPLFYGLMAGILVPPFVGTGIFFHSVHLVESKGWSLTSYAAAFPFYAGMSVVSSFVAGWAVDRWSAQHILPLAIVPMGLGAFVLGMATTPVAIFVALILIGMTAGLQSTAFGAIFPEVYGTRYLGAIRSLAMSAMVVASAGSPFALGMLIDLGVPFAYQLVVMAAGVAIAASVLYVVSRRLLKRTSTTDFAIVSS